MDLREVTKNFEKLFKKTPISAYEFNRIYSERQEMVLSFMQILVAQQDYNLIYLNVGNLDFNVSRDPETNKKTYPDLEEAIENLAQRIAGEKNPFIIIENYNEMELNAKNICHTMLKNLRIETGCPTLFNDYYHSLSWDEKTLKTSIYVDEGKLRNCTPVRDFQHFKAHRQMQPYMDKNILESHAYHDYQVHLGQEKERLSREDDELLDALLLAPHIKEQEKKNKYLP